MAIRVSTLRPLPRPRADSLTKTTILSGGTPTQALGLEAHSVERLVDLGHQLEPPLVAMEGPDCPEHLGRLVRHRVTVEDGRRKRAGAVEVVERAAHDPHRLEEHRRPLRNEAPGELRQPRNAGERDVEALPRRAARPARE